MEQTNTEITIIISTIIVLFITVGIILLFTIFQRRKNDLLKEKEQAKKEFEREITETQIEIREETLRNISWELHDNIGQLLTLAKIQLQNSTEDNIKDVSETITQGLNEVRSLSKLINPEVINNIDLKNAIQLEIDRLNRLNFVESKLIIIGKEQPIEEKSSTIIFRILQEFITNTIKHSRASELCISLYYQENELTILAKDNGIGFIADKKNKGIGLSNIKNRLHLIGADYKLISEKNNGTSLEILYKL